MTESLGVASRALLAAGGLLRRAEVSPDGRALYQVGGRQADTFYRDRWSYDKVVRSTHGVNCTGSCSWKVYVKDGIITWEAQQTDYPSVGPGPARVRAARLPARRGVLLVHLLARPGCATRTPAACWCEMYREAKAAARRPGGGVGGDPGRPGAPPPLPAGPRQGRAGAGLLGRGAGDGRRRARARDQGVRPGPGRRLLPDPGDVDGVARGRGPVHLASSAASMLSFYDWYADLPVASPQVFGDQTDVPESADWWDAAYLMMWGSNVPVTRTPDAHWMAEARYRGQKVVVVSPDYADNVKFADEWLPAQPGTDGALAMAMGHVILREFFVDRPRAAVRRLRRAASPTCRSWSRSSRARTARTAGQVPHRRRPRPTTPSNDAAFKPVVWDEAHGAPAVPNGSLGLPLGRVRRRPVEPGPGRASSRRWAARPAARSAEVVLPRFDTTPTPGVLRRGVPVRRVGGQLVTTVYDLLLAQYGVRRAGPARRSGRPSYEDADAAVHAGVAGADHRRAGGGGAPGSRASSPTTPSAPAAGR